jgi:type III pantothenate kinase
MILAVDIGNSRVKCAVVDGGRVIGREALATARCGNATTLAEMIRRVATAVLSVERAVVSSVVPPVTVGVIRAIEGQNGEPPRLVDYKTRLPFRLDVDAPARVGADRLCAAAGALGARRRNAVIIDAGSAITVDIVRDGVFLGGVIAAGPALALRALGDHASQLPAIDFASLDSPFPKRMDNTVDAMTLGASLGAVGAIRESVRYIEAIAGASLPKFVTGGAAPALLARLPRSWSHEPDLTLRGLDVIDQLYLTDL